MRQIDKIYIHCSATTASMDIGVHEIRQWHTDPKPRGRGWPTVAYHYVIRRNGVMEMGIPETQIGNGVAGANSHAIHICMVGGVRRENGKLYAEDNFTPAQYAQLKSIVRLLTAKYPGSKTLGHRDTDPRKECPSFSVRDWLVRDNVLENGIAWDSGVASPRPFVSTKTVGGAVVGGAASLMTVGEAVHQTAQQAQASAYSFPRLYLILGIVGTLGALVAIIGRWYVRRKTGE